MARNKGRPNRPHPGFSLTVAMQVAQAIAENNASRPMNRLLLAEAMNYSPGSSGFRERIASSAKYGLTEGNFNSETISLTVLGIGVTRPRNEAERIEARRSALRTVPLFDDLLGHFANSRLPGPEFLKNLLERDPYNIDPSWSEAAAAAFTDGAHDVGYLREIGGSPHIVLDASTTTLAVETQAAEAVDEPVRQSLDQVVSQPTKESSIPEISMDTEQSSSRSTRRPVPVQLFIAHGKNRNPLEQLKAILNGWKVPFLVAVDEPHAGRPISEKVADIMRQCSAGIFIFTADEYFQDSSGETVSRPSQNVVYELGAAALLYGRKIVILKEAGVTFPSDFSDLGWIEFDTDAVDAKGMDLLREMIALDAVRLVSAGSE